MTTVSRVIKADKAQEFQSWQTHLATLNEEFAPFFSLSSPSPAAPDLGNFSPDEVVLVSQAQASSDNWLSFESPTIGEGGEALSAEDLMIQQQMAMMAEAAGADFTASAAAEPVADDGLFDDGFDDGFGDTAEAPQVAAEQNEDDAFAEARQRGYDEGHEAGLNEGRVTGINQGQDQGFAEGEAKAQVALEKELVELEAAHDSLNQITNVLSDALMQPLQRLALHMARELVRGELTISDAAVTRLVSGCMGQLDQTQDKLQVYLNSGDLERLQADSLLDGNISYMSSAELQPGSVRVEQADSWVDDLVEDRLLMLSSQALGEPDEALLQPITHLDADEEAMLMAGPETEAGAETETTAAENSEDSAAQSIEEPTDSIPDMASAMSDESVELAEPEISESADFEAVEPNANSSDAPESTSDEELW